MLPKDANRFYEILMSMLEWAKKRKDVKIALKAAKADKDRTHYEVNDLLNIIWDRPELIDQYITEKGSALSAQVRQVLADWRKNFVPGPFFVERFTKAGAIFISAADGNVYLVHGITEDIDDIMDADSLPCFVFTTLIPYNGCIVYDSTMQVVPHFFDILDDQAPQMVTQVYDTAKRFNTIIRRLPANQALMTDKQRNLILKVMAPVLNETTKEEMKPAEFFKMASTNPNIHPIPEKDLLRYNKLLRKAHRNQEEWNTIMGILYSGDVFTAKPLNEMDSIKNVEGVLCHKDELLVFTTLKKCQKFLSYLRKSEPSLEYVAIGTISFEDAVSLADQYKKTLYIDLPIFGFLKKCIIYYGDTGGFHAGFILRR